MSGTRDEVKRAKCCANCKHWRKGRHIFGACEYPVLLPAIENDPSWPASVRFKSPETVNMRDRDGTDCPCFTRKRKGGC